MENRLDLEGKVLTGHNVMPFCYCKHFIFFVHYKTNLYVASADNLTNQTIDMAVCFTAGVDFNHKQKLF